MDKYRFSDPAHNVIVPLINYVIIELWLTSFNLDFKWFGMRANSSKCGLLSLCFPVVTWHLCPAAGIWVIIPARPSLAVYVFVWVCANQCELVQQKNLLQSWLEIRKCVFMSMLFCGISEWDGFWVSEVFPANTDGILHCPHLWIESAQTSALTENNKLPWGNHMIFSWHGLCVCVCVCMLCYAMLVGFTHVVVAALVASFSCELSVLGAHDVSLCSEAFEHLSDLILFCCPECVLEKHLWAGPCRKPPSKNITTKAFLPLVWQSDDRGIKGAQGTSCSVCTLLRKPWFWI